MTPFAQACGHLPRDAELDELLIDAAEILATIRGISDCHTAANKFVALKQKGTAIRGWYVPSKLWEHSWIDFGTYILDIYPVGGARPIVLVKEVAKALYLTEMPKPNDKELEKWLRK